MKKFNTSFNGYDKVEVNSFVSKVTTEYESMLSKLKARDLEISSLKEKLEYYTNLEKTLNKAIFVAEEAANQIKGVAKEESRVMMDNARRNASKIINDAYKEEKDDITIEYKIPKNESNINIFGKEFIKNNKDKCDIYINDKLRELSHNINLNNCLIENEILEIKLRLYENITDMSHMFSTCQYLYSLPDIHKLKTNNVTKMNNLFSMCDSLTSISDISKFLRQFGHLF